MQELETLLNSLIQRGWKPFKSSNLNYCNVVGKFVYFYTIKNPNKTTENLVYESLAVPLRLITTIESGLWQFVCERQLWGNERGYWLRCHSHPLDYEADYSWKFNYEFRLLESALIPEEELGEFLVDNIKIQW